MVRTRNIELFIATGELNEYLKEAVNYFNYLRLDEMIVHFNGWYYRLDKKHKISVELLLDEYEHYCQSRQ